MYGYDNIKPRFMSGASITSGGLNRQQMNDAKLKEILCAQGFCEMMNYSFYSVADLDMLGFAPDAAVRNAVRVANPLSEKYAIMRTTLAPSVVNILSHNAKKGNAAVRIFEMANIFVPTEAPKPDEIKTVGCGVRDRSTECLWIIRSRGISSIRGRDLLSGGILATRRTFRRRWDTGNREGLI